MSITRTLGKNTLGGGSRMKVNMKTYERSTHDLSRAWRSTMGVGTLVPCLKVLALPGDTYDIDIDSLIFTNPTIGPLFGQYKLQIDIFTCPIRLYIARLHNNEIDIAQNMENVKFPLLAKWKDPKENPTKENLYKEVSPSCILAYLGFRGSEYNKTESWINAVPLLSYWDIFANYYCNKQEKNYYQVGVTTEKETITDMENVVYDTDGYPTSGYFTIKINNTENYLKEIKVRQVGITYELPWFNLYAKAEGMEVTWIDDYTAKYEYTKKTMKIGEMQVSKGNNIAFLQKDVAPNIIPWKIETLNQIREDLLKQGKTQKIYKQKEDGEKGDNPIEWILGRDQDNLKTPISRTSYNLSGLALKTYQNDIFTNYVNSERVAAISNKTKVSTIGNSFSIDALNISQKIYNYQNRLAASNGTYKDWIEVGYTQNYGLRTETPLYEGGMSDTIVFESVVNTAATEKNPLGEIGGRGKLMGNKKGGKLHINVDEPSYIMGIVSITPYVDYCEGNDFDIYLDNMGQLHVPELDGIGYEDLKANQLAYWVDKTKAYAKTTAWQNYMTSYNQTYGEFCKTNNMAHMVLNRYVHKDTGDINEINTSTYINPEAYNYTFAQTGLTTQNFQVQIGFGIKARRKMSARIIPRI